MGKGWWMALAVALGCVAVGVALGEPGQVLMQAASVCLACMGIG
ncbi:MAG: hypothetical protein Kow0092_08620 [Deferrisomatales bacterium]